MDVGDAVAGAAGLELPDVSRLPLRQLIGTDDTVLTRSLRRVVREVEGHGPDRYAAFGAMAGHRSEDAEAAVPTGSPPPEV